MKTVVELMVLADSKEGVTWGEKRGVNIKTILLLLREISLLFLGVKCLYKGLL